MKTLPPQILKPEDFLDMEHQLKSIFFEIIFHPVFRIMEGANGMVTSFKVLENDAYDALRAALRSGRIQYSDGAFSGEFSSAVSKTLRKMGAKFDQRKKVYKLSPGEVPQWVKALSASYQAIAKDAHAAIRAQLDATQDQLAALVDSHTVDPDKTVARVIGSFAKAGKALEVMPELTPLAQAQLVQAYRNNMKLWIKQFSVETIVELREAVEENAQEGFRFDRLIARIQNRYGVAANKAKFLARQETGLFMAKYRRERFADTGIQRYRWSTSRDERVRHDHKDLDGKVFLYSQPPIVDRHTGRRGNPGEDYNCRCVDLPVLDAAEALEYA